ncbi:unnamed protein product [Rotaria sordida]|uniref:Condensin complex subunit 1 N-terminal domain-containing protein n=1 Tax=Rotaria sordida TaxID=392033 RepID=A0A814HHH9_9BILA|nr:unnamed protein product [Rotaria sordida]CAF1010919.1 unnamed protein product [Rotaria sordida]
MSVRNSKVEINGWATFDVLNQFEDLQKQLATADDRRFHLNIIKMLSSLLDEYIIRFDNDQSNKSLDFDMLAPKKGKKVKEAENSGKSTLTFDALRDKCLKGLCDIFRSHIKPYWDSSIIDEQFINNSSLLITVLNSLLTDYQDTSLSIELLKEICETNFVAA